MMRSFYGVPLIHELEKMPDIDLAELQSRLVLNFHGIIIIENEWKRRKSNKVTPKPTDIPLTVIGRDNQWYLDEASELSPIKN